tara:strand:+ start:258 stop:455 length:198 start_codon:yes stop_codon:yes gene_type:complete
MWVIVPMSIMELSELAILLWAFIITWISISNQYRLNLIDDSKSKLNIKEDETTQQLTLNDFAEEE